MTETAVALYLLLAFGLLLMSAKYAFGPVPASHHRAALERDGAPLTPTLLVILHAIYVPMSAAIAAFALLLAALALGPIWDGERWATLTATGAALVLGVPTTISTWTFERRTGIRGPYRLAAVMTALAVVALPFAW